MRRREFIALLGRRLSRSLCIENLGAKTREYEESNAPT